MDAPGRKIFIRSEIQLAKLSRLGLGLFLLALVTFILAASFSHVLNRRPPSLAPAGAHLSTRALDGFAGLDWRVRGGEWRQEREGIMVSGPALAVSALDTPDHLLEVSLQAGDRSIQHLGAVFRFDEAQGGYLVRLDPSQRLHLDRMNSGGDLEPLAWVRLPIDPFEVHRYRIEARGSRLRVWLDGVQAFDYTDREPLAGTEAGMMMDDESWAGADLDARPLVRREIPPGANADEPSR